MLYHNACQLSLIEKEPVLLSKTSLLIRIAEQLKCMLMISITDKLNVRILIFVFARFFTYNFKKKNILSDNLWEQRNNIHLFFWRLDENL